jgi:site-specific DNA recombinase
MRIALYARVSTSRQQQTHTIDQQLARLRAYVTTQPDWSLVEEHIFCDDGQSGAKLKRPGLDHLRDQAAQAAFDLVLLTAPDRLARNYVHQIVVLEELEHNGCPVQFLDRPISDDPHDQLLLQIRGAVAEYERTLIAERMRRGRQAKIRSGQLLPWSRVPYGYRAHPERPRDARRLTIDPIQAAIVQELFQTYADGGVSLYHLALGLTRREVRSPTGVAHWTANTVRLILLNPCYTGSACANRIRTRPATRRKSPLQPIGPGESWSFTPAEEWIRIPIPAIIAQEVFARVQARLATNQQMARRSTRHDELLRSLVQCGQCHLQCHGHFRSPDYYYYLCRGKQNAVSSCHDQRCPTRYIPADQLETLVWQDLCEVIQHPELITLALERAQRGAWLPDEIQHRQATIQQALRSPDRQRERLLAAYLAEALELPEFERRQRELVQQRDDLQIQARQLAHVSDQLDQARAAIPTIQALCERLQVGLAQATFAQRREVIELLIDCVIVSDDQVEIRYVIPTTEASTHIRFCHLRKDYFDPHASSTPLVGLVGGRQIGDDPTHDRLALIIFGPPGNQIDRPIGLLGQIDLLQVHHGRAVDQPVFEQLARSLRGRPDIGIALDDQEGMTAVRAQPLKQRMAAELAITVDMHPHALGQERVRLPHQLLLVGQVALAAMLQGLPDQLSRAAPEADADHQDVVPILQQHPIDEQMDPLPFQPGQGLLEQRLIVLSLGNPLIVQKPAQALFLDHLSGIEWHGAGNLAQLRRDALGDTDQDERERIELAGADIGQACCQSGARAIIQLRGGHGVSFG